MNPSRAVIFANGELNDLEAARVLLQPNDLLVAADGGLHHLQRLGLLPAVLIGDLDSVDPAEVPPLEAAGVRVLRYPPEKDETDLELALQYVLSAGCRAIRILGALGGRLDQTLGNLFLLSRSDLESCDVRLDDGREEVFLIRQQAVVEGLPGDTVSLLPLDGPAVGVVTQGLYYPLHAETLYPERTRGISNVLLAGRASVSIKKGLLVCIHTRKG
jgi:thiamine pyrophosphokinase